MTLDGTNTWLIAEPGSSSVVVVDPGPDDEGHLRRVHAAAEAGERRVATILLTHGHPDHSAGAPRFARLTGAPGRAADPAHRLGAEAPTDGDGVTTPGAGRRVVRPRPARLPRGLRTMVVSGLGQIAPRTAHDHGVT